MILAEDDESVELIDIECGKDGQPFLFAFSMDARTSYYLQQLKQHAGEGNYTFVIGSSGGDEDVDEDEINEQEMED